MNYLSIDLQYDAIEFLPPKIEFVIRSVAHHYGVTVNDIKSASHKKIHVLPRQIAMYLAKHWTPRSLAEIGRRLGGRDHTTVCHGVRKISGLLESNDMLAAEVAYIKDQLALGIAIELPSSPPEPTVTPLEPTKLPLNTQVSEYTEKVTLLVEKKPCKTINQQACDAHLIDLRNAYSERQIQCVHNA